MTRISNTFKGTNGTFTAVYFKRSGEWFPGVWDRQTDKRKYGIGCYSAYAAAGEAMDKAKLAAGDGAEMVLPNA